MKTKMLPIAMVFAASMAWANAAHAEEPCGAPLDGFSSCQIVEAPHCQAACAVEAMEVTCVAANADQCLAQCADLDSVSCPAACELQCDSSCAAEVIKKGPQDCAVSCGSACMGECAAGCEVSQNKTTCFAECNQACSAYCQVSCDIQETELDIDSGLDQTQERSYYPDYRRYYDRCKNRYGRNYHRYCKDRRSWERDRYERCKRKYGRNYHRYCQRPGGRYYRSEIENLGELGQAFSHEGGVDEIASQCTQGCQQSCVGTCESSSVRQCEIGCQAELNSVCAPQMSSSCSEECSRGAVLLCDGEWLAVRDVDACFAALEHEGLTVDGRPGALQGREVVIDALQGASCSIEQPSKRGLFGALLGLFGLGLGASFLRRRRS